MATVNVEFEFVGLCLAVVSKKTSIVEICLLDATAVGGPEHSATLVVPDHPGLMGVPDFVVADASHEFAGWALAGQFSIGGRIDSTGSAIDLSKTADLHTIAETSAVSVDAPVRARCALPRGLLKSSGSEHDFNFYYDDPLKGETAVYPRPVKLVDRLALTLKVDGPLRFRIPRASGGERLIVISKPEELPASSPIRIANITAGVAKGAPHFEVYYEAVASPSRHPKIRRIVPKKQGADIPDNPDECRCMFVVD